MLESLGFLCAASPEARKGQIPGNHKNAKLKQTVKEVIWSNPSVGETYTLKHPCRQRSTFRLKTSSEGSRISNPDSSAPAGPTIWGCRNHPPALQGSEAPLTSSNL